MKIPQKKNGIPGAAVSGSDFFNTAPCKKCLHAKTVDSIIVTEDITWLLSERSSILELLNDPVHGRGEGSIKMNDSSTTMIEDEKNIQGGKLHCSDRTEVKSPGDIKVIS